MTHHAIAIYCDDGAHPGKVADIGSFNLMWGTWFFTPTHRAYRGVGGRPRPSATGGDLTTGTASLKCSLCLRNPQIKRGQADALLNALVERGDTRVSLATLDAFAARGYGR